MDNRDRQMCSIYQVFALSAYEAASRGGIRLGQRAATCMFNVLFRAKEEGPVKTAGTLISGSLPSNRGDLRYKYLFMTILGLK
jgi:hypothetical protein